MYMYTFYIIIIISTMMALSFNTVVCNESIVGAL